MMISLEINIHIQITMPTLQKLLKLMYLNNVSGTGTQMPASLVEKNSHNGGS
jgi:hypothetical protein